MNAILLIGTLAAMTALHWRLSLLALLAFPLVYFLTRKTRGRAQSLYRDQSDLLEAGQSYLHEVFPGLRTIRASNAQSYEEGRWREWLTDHRNIKARVATFHELIRIVLPESINQIAAGLVFQVTFLWNATITKSSSIRGAMMPTKLLGSGRSMAFIGLPHAYETVLANEE